MRPWAVSLQKTIETLTSSELNLRYQSERMPLTQLLLVGSLQIKNWKKKKKNSLVTNMMSKLWKQLLSQRGWGFLKIKEGSVGKNEHLMPLFSNNWCIAALSVYWHTDMTDIIGWFLAYSFFWCKIEMDNNMIWNNMLYANINLWV